MLNKFVISAVFVLGMAAPALADSSSCSEPYPPAAIDGSTATEDQLKAAVKDVKSFIADSDVYQSCLLSDLAQQKREAAKSKDKTPLDPSIVAGVDAKLKSNQALKEKVGAEYNAAVQAYKAKHPQ
jgi:hypothetical protein